MYTEVYYSVPQNKSNREIFIMNADGSGQQQLTATLFRKTKQPLLKRKQNFLSSESGSSQLWEMDLDGTNRKQLSQYDGDVKVSFSPDGKKVLLLLR